MSQIITANFVSGKRGPTTPVVSLWKEIIMSLFVGGLVTALGVLGVCAYFACGPLHQAFIPVPWFTGHVINASNVSALIAGIATLFATIGRYVLSGVARAWLRRRAGTAQGPRIKDWRTISAGLSFRDAIRTPFLAGGLVFCFTAAIAIQTSALLGVAIPGAVLRSTPSTYSKAIPLSNNSGRGTLINCVRLSNGDCAQFASIGAVNQAFGDGLALTLTGASFNYLRTVVSSSDVYAAGVLPAIRFPATAFNTMVWTTPMSTFTASCSPISDEGRSGSSFYVSSACLGAREFYGNASQTNGTYSWAGSCVPAGNTQAVFEIAMGGALLNSVGGTYAARCVIAGREGMGTAKYTYGQDTAFSPSGAGAIMPTADVLQLTSAVVAGIKSDVGLEGVSTAAQFYLKLAIARGDASKTLASALSNALAASAMSAYTQLWLDVASTSLSDIKYQGTYSSLLLITNVDGFGWLSTPRILAWSTMCLLIGFVWILLALYMLGKGTRYNPTDWYHTLNTSAGSSLIQAAGTCTSAHLKTGTVNKERLWYGELHNGHVGFSQHPTAPLQAKALYGQV